jgi:hypothetical protein
MKDVSRSSVLPRVPSLTANDAAKLLTCGEEHGQLWGAQILPAPAFTHNKLPSRQLNSRCSMPRKFEPIRATYYAEPLFASLNLLTLLLEYCSITCNYTSGES